MDPSISLSLWLSICIKSQEYNISNVKKHSWGYRSKNLGNQVFSIGYHNSYRIVSTWYICVVTDMENSALCFRVEVSFRLRQPAVKGDALCLIFCTLQSSKFTFLLRSFHTCMTLPTQVEGETDKQTGVCSTGTFLTERAADWELLQLPFRGSPPHYRC